MKISRHISSSIQHASFKSCEHKCLSGVFRGYLSGKSCTAKVDRTPAVNTIPFRPHGSEEVESFAGMADVFGKIRIQPKRHRFSPRQLIYPSEIFQTKNSELACKLPPPTYCSQAGKSEAI